MTKIISITNEKGGVGKTTSTSSIGSILSRMGYKVLLIDLDPQADLTVSFDIEAEDRNIFDCLFTHKKIKASPINENLVLVGGDPRLTPIEFSDSLKKDKDLQFDNPRLILGGLLNSVKNQVDFVLIDCPPNRELITQNALACSDYVLIPSEAHSFSVNGISNIIDYVNAFKRSINPSLEVLGIFITRLRTTTNVHSDMKEWFMKNYRDELFDTTIHENITLQEATMRGRELEEHDNEKRKLQLVKSKHPFKGLQDYRELVFEILNRLDYVK